MKHYQFLAICTTALLLSACGGGSGGNFTTPNNNNLGQNYTVPNHLKDAVREAMTYPVDWDPAPGHSALTLGNKTYNKDDRIDLASFPLGYSEVNSISSDSEGIVATGKYRIYRLPYSVIIAELILDAEPASDNTAEQFSYTQSTGPYVGYLTQNLPQTGKATYTGKSFYNEEIGDFNMAVDFADKKVTDGSITGLTKGDVFLSEGEIQPVEYIDGHTQIGFAGEAVFIDSEPGANSINFDKNSKSFVKKEYSSSDYDFNYSGHFFGPNAEEVGGLVWAENKTNPSHNYVLINFAGQCGEIK